MAFPTLSQDEHGTQLALVPSRPSAQLIMPIASPAAVVQAIKAYEEMKSAILLTRDTQKIGDKIHIKKSGWLRIALAFGVTVEPVSAQFERAEDGDWGYSVVVRAMAPNGASMQGDGACWASEKVAKPWIEKGAKEPTQSAIARAAEKTKDMQTRHNVRAHAFTRAMNRAISNLVGGGEVSAEELTNDYVDADPAPAAPTAHSAGRQAASPPASPQAPAKVRKWASLQARAHGAQMYETQDEWKTLILRICGLSMDPAKATNEDYDAVEQAIADKEAENAALEAVDLHDLGTDGNQ